MRTGGDKAVKLSDPQWELLHGLPTTCAEAYRPAQRLVSLGLARWEHGSYGSTVLWPTDLGYSTSRARLASPAPMQGGR